jgi:hypothetical protein
MRMPRAALILLPLTAIPLLGGCPTEPPPRAKEPVVVEDEWARIPPSKEWLHATADYSGDHQAECAHVLTWVTGEETCRASLCEHGRDLAHEWLQRCAAKLTDADSAAKVKALEEKLTERATEKATDCGKSFDAMLRDGCSGADTTCASEGQRWATRCGKSEATPLVMRLLEKTIERKLPEPAKVELDPRTCDELAADVAAVVACKDQFACAAALPRVDTYQSRCVSDAERPTITAAVQLLAVRVGAGKPAEPLVTRAGGAGILADEAPVVLADGSGAVISICDERASDFARYLAGRKACSAGKMVVARAFKGARGVEVRVGALDFPDDATFTARYPTIVGARETEARDKEESAALTADLNKAVELAQNAAGAAEAYRLLARALVAHAPSIRRSAGLRAQITARDAALVLALKELGKAKVAALKGRVPAPDADGLIERARTRAFADVTPDGSVQIGAASRADRLDTTALLPQAMFAYLAALKPARLKKLDKNAVQIAKAAGTAAATSCGAALRKLQDSKLALINCSFGLETCDEARTASLNKLVDGSRLAAEAAFHELDLARTGGAVAETDALAKAAEQAGCREPWW